MEEHTIRLESSYVECEKAGVSQSFHDLAKT
jgi:hypothetical protein